MDAAEALQALFQQADQLQTEVHTRYPEMICHAGCGGCCEHHGSPIAYALEWQAILPLLEQDNALKERVKTRFLAIKQSLRQSLKSGQVVGLREALFEASCPFLEQQRCSIYAQRPLTCRTFGNTRLYEDSDPLQWQEIYSCTMEKERWETQLKMAGDVPIELPVRETLFQSLEKLDKKKSSTLLVFLERYFADATS
jgi:Fe-S-cluster containining protein